MDCSSPKSESALSRPAKNREHDRESSALERIGRILDTKKIDLTDLVEAICAVPDLAHHLRRLVAETGAEFETVSEATVLAGRSGIRMILCDYLPASHASGRAMPFVSPTVNKSSSTRTKFR